MFSFALRETKARIKSALAAPWRACIGAAFVALAMFAIQYEENFAPGLNRVGDAWSSVAEFGRRTLSL